MFVEPRRYPRMSVDRSVELVDRATGMRYILLARNAGGGGLFILHESPPLAPGAKVEIILDTDATMRIDGVVAFVAERGFGVRFSSSNDVLIEQWTGAPNATEGRLCDLAALGDDPESFIRAHPYPILLRHDGAPTPEEKFYVLRGRRDAGPWDPVVIGRGPTCDVRIDDTRISREHARIERDPHDGSFLLKDLGSRNGTSLDGERLAPKRAVFLPSGTAVAFGGLGLRFFIATDLFRLLAQAGAIQWNP